MTYKTSKTIAKVAEPALIIPVAECLEKILPAVGIDIPQGIIYPAVIAIFGAIQGFINWAKNRKKR